MGAQGAVSPLVGQAGMIADMTRVGKKVKKGLFVW
jgi:hypothetical protein